MIFIPNEKTKNSDDFKFFKGAKMKNLSNNNMVNLENFNKVWYNTANCIKPQGEVVSPARNRTELKSISLCSNYAKQNCDKKQLRDHNMSFVGINLATGVSLWLSPLNTILPKNHKSNFSTFKKSAFLTITAFCLSTNLAVAKCLD